MTFERFMVIDMLDVDIKRIELHNEDVSDFVMLEKSKFVLSEGQGVGDINIWLNFQYRIMKKLGNGRKFPIELLTVIGDFIIENLIRKSVDNYVGNNLFSMLYYGLVEDNVGIAVLKAYVGILSSVFPEMLSNDKLYLSPILINVSKTKTRLFSEIDFAVLSYLSDPKPILEDFIKDFILVYTDFNDLDNDTVDMIVSMYGERKLLRDTFTRFFKMYEKESNREFRDDSKEVLMIMGNNKDMADMGDIRN